MAGLATSTWRWRYMSEKYEKYITMLPSRTRDSFLHSAQRDLHIPTSTSLTAFSARGVCPDSLPACATPLCHPIFHSHHVPTVCRPTATRLCLLQPVESVHRWSAPKGGSKQQSQRLGTLAAHRAPRGRCSGVGVGAADQVDSLASRDVRASGVSNLGGLARAEVAEGGDDPPPAGKRVS